MTVSDIESTRVTCPTCLFTEWADVEWEIRSDCCGPYRVAYVICGDCGARIDLAEDLGDP